MKWTPRASRRAWLAVLSVAVGSFTLVTNEVLPVGLISDVAADLHVSEGTAGTMITAPGIVAAISALALPVLLQRVNRRVALLGLSLTFVLADVLAGLAPNYPTMLGARALLALGIGGFWAIAVGVGPGLVPEQLGPRATALIFGGISIGTVVGVPAGPLLGHQFGWRGAFLIVAGLGLIPVTLQALFLPRLAVTRAVTLGSLGVLLKSSRARIVLGVSFLTITAQFTAYTFVAPFLQPTWPGPPPASRKCSSASPTSPTPWRPGTAPRPDLTAARHAVTRGLDIDDSAEILYQDWMLIEDQAGNRAGVSAAYETLRGVNQRLEIGMEGETEKVFDTIMSRTAS